MPWEEAKTFVASLDEGTLSPRDAKMRLAWEITKINHGEEAAIQAQDNFVRIVQNKEVPLNIDEKILKPGTYKVIDLVVALGLSASRGEARRLIEQGGIKIGSLDKLEIINDSQQEIAISSGLICQRGKRQFIKIKAE
jgi:tyrosyl-tRNA synthetase